ncbi:MAG TPA: sialidase family protein [Thermoanaerobaculia bacterium]|nr:sialidase family protein [Thermoanaerobaculia bacterium]
MKMRIAVAAGVALSLSLSLSLESQEAPSTVVAATNGHVWETSITFSGADPYKAVAIGVLSGVGNANVQPFYTDDGGKSWHYGGSLGYTTAKRTYVRHGDPVVASDRRGVMYAATLLGWPNSYPLTYGGIGVSRSFDNGRTWEQPVGVVERAPEDNPRYSDDKEWIAVDTTGGPHDGNIYVSWLRVDVNNSSRIDSVFSRSTDGGVTWSPEVVLGSGSGAQMSIGPNSVLHLLRTCGDGTYCSQRSTDGGVTFEAPVRIASSATFLSNAVDVSSGPHRGNVYVAWIASITGPQLSRSWVGTVYFSRSTDGGRSWEAPRALTPVNGSTGVFQTLACDPLTGNLVVTWLDRREHPGTTKFRLYSTRSTDGGATFGEQKPLTGIVDMAASGFIGDYNTTAAAHGVFLSTFSDGLGRMSVTRQELERPVPRGPKRRSVRR